MVDDSQHVEVAGSLRAEVTMRPENDALSRQYESLNKSWKADILRAARCNESTKQHISQAPHPKSTLEKSTSPYFGLKAARKRMPTGEPREPKLPSSTKDKEAVIPPNKKQCTGLNPQVSHQV